MLVIWCSRQLLLNSRLWYSLLYASHCLGIWGEVEVSPKGVAQGAHQGCYSQNGEMEMEYSRHDLVEVREILLCGMQVQHSAGMWAQLPVPGGAAGLPGCTAGSGTLQ